MKRLALFAFTFAGLAACDTPPTPSEPTIAGPSFAVVTNQTSADAYGVGGGSINFGGAKKFTKFAFSGHTGPQGDFGHFRFTIEDPSTPLDAHVDVDCVNVFPFPPLGAGGWIGGVVTRATPQPNVFGFTPGDQLLFGINDFGGPSDPTRDQLNAYFGSPQVCKLFGPSLQIPIDQGNITIKTG